MRIALIYAPPWKIPLPGVAADTGPDGPPDDVAPGDLDADFFQTPYGLFTLGAQALRAGHQVKVLNLSGFAWAHVERVIASLDADLWGLSCWTANRRGVALVAREIRERHPRAHIVVGGPHATPFATEMLAHHPSIDTIAVGESESTLMELIQRLEHGEPTTGLAGTFFRDGTGAIRQGPKRASIHDLDTLAAPQDYFDTHILMTSRGCPWACTFCGADTTWGRGFRGQSVPYVLDALEKALERLPVKLVQIKDDTFTTNRKRVVELCRGIRARGLRFLWSCDTRVDVLSEELLYEMRLAGCQRLSLGVESGAQSVLDAIDKKITVDEIIASTQMARRNGIQVRYYMMLGNRGETAETFRETLAFLESAKPDQYLFSCLSIYPGTPDFRAAEAAGWLDREVYFTQKFQELKVPFDASPEDTVWMREWFQKNRGLRTGRRATSAEYEAVLARLGDHAPAHLDLGAGYYEDGRLDEAEEHVRRALALGYPAPGVVHNYLGCIAYARGARDAAIAHFADGIAVDPQHAALLANHERMLASAGAGGMPAELEAMHDFHLLERTMQPTLPGPLAADFAVWGALRVPTPVTPIRPAEIAVARERRRLEVLVTSDR